MGNWIPILNYGEFYDLPRQFVIRYEGRLVYFESPFVEAEDDYSEAFDVYLLPEMSVEETKKNGLRLKRLAEKKLGSVRVEDIRFDSSKRGAIDEQVFAALKRTTGGQV